MAQIFNNPHALYYNGELMGIITNADPMGSLQQISEALSPDDPELCELRPMRVTSDLVEVLKPLSKTIEVPRG